MADNYDDLITKARECFKLAVDSDSRQREQEREDLRFQVPEEQWTEQARNERRGGVGTPARPMVSVTQLDAPLRLMLAQARAARLGINVHPISEDANEDTAEVYQGLYRRIERDSNANDGRLWAFDRSLKCGRGYYRVLTAFDEDSDPKYFDQEIRIQRILYQENVYLDPSAQEPDWSDGEWAFVGAWVPLDTIKRKYPKANISKITGDKEWLAESAREPEWVRGGYGKDAAVLVCEYWYKEHQTEVITVEGQDGPMSREKDTVTVKVCKLAGSEMLEEPQLWNGQYIPIIPVVGQELQPFDERRRFNGMVTNAKDAQRIFNHGASSMVEGLSLEPKAPFVGYVGQFETDKKKWDTVNIKNFPYVESDIVTVDGKPAPLPQRMQVDGARMNLSIMALQQAGVWIQDVTAVKEPSLGGESQKRLSGRAILALQGQTDQSTSAYLSNLERAMNLEARIVLDLIPHIYDRPGRITPIIRGDDDSSEFVALNQPFVMQGKRPMPLQPGAPPPQNAKTFDLTKGKYGIAVDVGKSYKTRLKEGDEALTELVTAKPELLPIVGDIWFKFRDQPGSKEISKRLAKWREMQFPGLGEGEDGQMPPEQAQAMLQRAQQENQQLQQQLQQAAQALQTEQAKQQAAVLKAQMDQQTDAAKMQADLELARMDNEVKLTIAAAQEETKRLIAGMQAQVEGLRQIVETDRAARQQQADSDMADRESQEAETARGHEVAMETMRRPPPTAPGAGEMGSEA